MAKATSAGLLLFERYDVERHDVERHDELRVLLAHPGGPYFAKKDEGAWSIPKGLVAADEELLDAAKREFVEETGYEHLVDQTRFFELGSVKLKSGKEVFGWAFAGAWETGRVPQSNHFEIEWPPRSGKKQSFPEIDRAELFSIEQARIKINERQAPFLDRLIEVLGTSHGRSPCD